MKLIQVITCLFLFSPVVGEWYSNQYTQEFDYYESTEQVQVNLNNLTTNVRIATSTITSTYLTNSSATANYAQFNTPELGAWSTAGNFSTDGSTGTAATDIIVVVELVCTPGSASNFMSVTFATDASVPPTTVRCGANVCGAASGTQIVFGGFSCPVKKGNKWIIHSKAAGGAAYYRYHIIPLLHQN